MWCSDLFNELIPLCPGCQSPFDMRRCSPQILPCSHTLCLACVTSDSKVRKLGRRRCLTCDKRYSTFHLNTALGETIERIRVRRDALESQSRRCDECDKRAYLSWMRRCITCEIQLKEAQLTSVICMECCVDRHNGHALRVVTADPYALKEEKIGHISMCGSTSSSTQYRSTVSGHSSMNSPSIHSSTRLHSTSSASSGVSSGGVVSSPGVNIQLDTRNGITQKMSSFFSRVATRSGSLAPPHTLSVPNQGMSVARKPSYIPPPFSHQSGHSGHRRSHSVHRPPPPTMNLPIAPSPSNLKGRGFVSAFRPAMGTFSSYMEPNRGMTSLKKSLDDLDDRMPKGDILRAETSPFYDGHSQYGMSLLVGGSTSLTPSPSPPPYPAPPSRPLSEVKTNGRRASLPLSDREYHRLSPFPGRRREGRVDGYSGPLMLPYSKTSNVIGGGTVKVQSPLANVANMPRRNPRIRGGPAYLHDAFCDPYYENQQRFSLHSSISTDSSNGGERGYRSTVERKEGEERREEKTADPATATFYDRHGDEERKKPAAIALSNENSQYINVTRSCENLPSQLNSLDVNNNDEKGRRGGGRLPIRRALFSNESDHCCSYEYIGS